MLKNTPLMGGAAIVATAGLAASAHGAPNALNGLLAHAEVVGPAGQPELIIPMETPGWAQALGVTATSRYYKGLCGPDGAAATIEQLIAHAERDLNGWQNRGALTTQSVGTSPQFDISFNALNALLVGFYLPDFVEAAEFVDRQFNNRVVNRVDLDVQSIPGSTIGSAGSTRYTIPWSIYVEGLRESSDREDDDFADALPLNSLPVRYGFPGASITSETQIVVTDAQLRAVFGETAVPPTNSVSITLDSDNAWAFFGCAVAPVGSQLSLIDVAVHEITHSLGYTSNIAEGGGNSSQQIQGLDVARFFQDFLIGPTLPGVQGGPPINNQQFTAFERHGQFAILSGFSSHTYSSTPNGFSTLLEDGVDNQPSHLARRDTFADKLGIMDPVLISGTTFCDSFYSQADTQPLDDMGWTYITPNAIQDCNSNGLPDIIDIVNGAPDTNTNLIPDACENFFADVNIGPAFTGLTLSEWSAPGLSTLSGFNPNNFSLIFRGATDDATIDHNSGADIVARVSGFFNAPATGEYAFRVGHDEPATLRVAGQTLMAINSNRALDGFDSSNIAPQNFINLDAGFHAFELTVILNSSSDDVTVIADSPALGGWRALNQSDFAARLSDFPDCNSNGIDDQFDADSDGDGTPDDCEQDCDGDGIPDETQVTGDFANATNLGTVAAPGETLTIETVGSGFDTEIGLYDASGTLIVANDDIQPGLLQSRIVEVLPEGEYFLGVGGFNVAFVNGPGVNLLGSTCQASGDLEINFDSASGNRSDSTVLASGRTQWYAFNVTETADCDGDGIVDSQELDCDNNGVPDDCEIFDIQFGGDTIGDASQAIVINTRGSAFDTEIAVWDADGTLLATNDDISFPANTQSEIVRMYDPGDYVLVVAGFNTVFSDFSPDFTSGGVAVNQSGCAAGGLLSLEAGSVSAADFFELPSGRVAFFPFTIAEAPQPCNDADLSLPFGVLDLADINAFVAGFTSQDAISDLDGNGIFDLSDINQFVIAFTGGCP